MPTKPNTALDLLEKIDAEAGLQTCWNWTKSKFKNGYGQISKDGHPKAAHRWVYEHFYNVQLKPSQIVRHKCDNPSCCNPLHLLLGTQVDNIRDMLERQRWRPGKQPKEINEETKQKIIKLAKIGLSQRKIASALGCSQMTVSRTIKKEKDRLVNDL